MPVDPLVATWSRIIADTSVGGDFPGNLVNFGLGGVIILAIIFGFLWPKPSVEQLRADKDAVTKQRDDLMKTMVEEVIPALNAVAKDVLPALVSAKGEMHEAGLALAKLSDEVRRLGNVVDGRPK